MIDTDPCNANDASVQAAPIHQNFRWIEGAARDTPYAHFLETVLDISTGVYTGLQMAYASALEHAANMDADDATTVAPAIGVVEADHLTRLSIAAIGLLRDEARRRVARLNGVEKTDTTP